METIILKPDDERIGNAQRKPELDIFGGVVTPHHRTRVWIAGGPEYYVAPPVCRNFPDVRIKDDKSAKSGTGKTAKSTASTKDD